MNDIDIENCLGEVVRRIDHWKMLNAPLSLAGEMELNMIADEIEYLGGISTKQLDSLEDDLKEAQYDIDRLKERIIPSELEAKIESLRVKIEVFKRDLRRSSEAVSERDAKIDAMQATINDLDKDKKRLEEQIIDLEKNQYAQAW